MVMGLIMGVGEEAGNQSRKAASPSPQKFERNLKYYTRFQIVHISAEPEV